jgi:integrase
MRQRKQQRQLPACVYQKHGAYWLVKRNKWTRLGSDLPAALAEYARLHEQKLGGMPALIAQAMPTITAGKAASTQKQYRDCAAKLSEAFADFAPHQVTGRDVATLRRAHSTTPAIANRLLTVLKLVFDFALEEQMVDHNPVIGIKRMTLAARTRRISRAEFDLIKAQARPMLKVIMDLCFATGQRIGDVLKVSRADVTDAGVFVQQQKTGSRLMLAWTPELRAAVADAKALHGNVSQPFLLGATPPNYHMIHKQWTIACNLAGIDDANLHDLRAMSGTEADAQGIDAQKLLGHTDSRVTQRYLRDKIVPVVSGPSIRQRSK